VSRVIVASSDPNPLVDGRGLRALREAGIAVEIGPFGDEERRLNAAFRRHVRTNLPFVVLKLATSLDGRAAAADGTSRWITGERARADAHRIRAWADAVVVGAGTVLADDPALTVRVAGLEEARPPMRVVVDAVGRVPPDRRLFDDEAPTVVATTSSAPETRIGEWARAGAEVLVLEPDVGGGVDVHTLLAALGKRDVQGVLVEGGPTLAWAFVREGAVDRVVAYVAPLLIGGAAAPGGVMGDGFAPLGRALRLDLRSVELVGDDVRVEADVHRDR
jgi:diaminohydroxyphosphoribosylaminopyrimidine deaminase/5-amino-6-(5-phosphoribosylamino)uracil reductase